MAKPERILAHELLDHEVMDLSAGRILGTVVDFAISGEGRVTQLGILPVEWYLGGKGIEPEHIANINADRVCIASAESLAPFAPDSTDSFSALQGDRFLGKPVLQHDGEVLGELADFWINLKDGRISDLVVIGDDDKRVKVALEAIKTVGTDYIVIDRAPAAIDAPAEPEPAPGKAKAAGASQPPDAVKTAEPVAAPPAKAAAPSAEPKADAKPKLKEPEVEEPEPGATAPDKEASAAVPEQSEPVKPSKPASTPPVEPPREEPKIEIPPELEADPPPPPPVVSQPSPEPTRSEEKQALFGSNKAGANLSKFDQKKCDYLRGRPAHREIKDASGDVLAAKGDALDDVALQRIIDAGMLADVFIEMTVNK